jgi:hypothetical protein
MLHKARSLYLDSTDGFGYCRLSGHLALLSVTVQSLMSVSDSHDDTSPWHHDVVTLCKMLDMTDHSFANILCILSAALTDGHSLPPNTRAPPPYQLDHHLTQLDKDIFDLKHISHPEYCAFAAAQMLSAIIMEDLHKLVRYCTRPTLPCA